MMRLWRSLFLVGLLAVLAGCSREKPAYERLEVPGVETVEFHSSALGRQMRYVALLPADYSHSKSYPVLYLLHGANSAPEEWFTNSRLRDYAQGKNILIIAVQGDNSWYTNAALTPADRYEDYVVNDVVSDAERHFHSGGTREQRFIAGLSMGGYGALKIALKHPERFSFAASLSGALDIAARDFAWQHYAHSWQLEKIFGPARSGSRFDADIFEILKRVPDGTALPFIYLACGDNEGLLPVNKRFAAEIKKRDLPYQFHVGIGGHDWRNWDAEIQRVIELASQPLQSARPKQ